MILVFGGTTEGKQAIEVLTTMGLPFLYSTKVNIEIETNNKFEYRFGALDAMHLESLIEGRKITTIINASHPFASELHKTIAQVSQKTKTPVLRLERTYPEKTKHSLVHYVSDYTSALELLKTFNGKRLLALSGVQSIVKLASYWKTTTAYFRILDRASSIAIAQNNNFPKQQLILGLPNKTIEEEIAVFQQHKIETVLTKESGESGALSIKIKAALQQNIPIVILERPQIPRTFIIVKNKEVLKKKLKVMYNQALILNTK